LRRAIVVFLLGVCVFGVAALAGFYAASRMAPEQLRREAESRLSVLLKAPVRLAEVRVNLTQDLPWLQLEARGLRADLLPGGAALGVEALSARIDPILLVLGRLELRGLHVTGIELSLPEPTTGGASEAPGARREDAASRAVALLTSAADRLRARPCPIPPVDAERLALSLTSAAAPPRRVLELGELSFRCGVLSGEGAWKASGRVLLPSAASAPFTVQLDVADDQVDGRLTLTPAPLGPLLATLRQPRTLEGRASGELRWRSRPGAPHELRAVVLGERVRGKLGGSQGPADQTIQLELRQPKLELGVDASAAELRTTQLAFSDGSVSLDGSLALGLPVSEASRIEGEVRAGEIDRAELDRVAALLPRGARQALERPLERFVRGTIRDLDLRLHSTLAGMREIAAGEVLRRTGDLALELRLDGAELRIGKADLLSGVSAALDFAGDRLELHADGAQFRERRLPRLRLVLTGVTHVRSLDAIQCDRPAPVARIAGLDDLRAWIESRRRLPYVPTWNTLALDIDRVSHPLLMCTAEGVGAKILRLDNGYDYVIERGSWAGFAVSGRATWQRGRQSEEPQRDAGSVDVVMALGDRRPAAAPARDPEVWAEGRFAYDVNALGRFLTTGYDGSFRARGARAELYDTRLHLAPSGQLEGNLTVDLRGDGPVPFQVEAQTRDLDLLALWKISQAPKTLMSGTLNGAAVLSGHLKLGESPLADVSGYASLHARKGEIYRDVPFLLALAMTDEKINPFGKRDRFPYKAIDLEGPISGGWMTSRTLTLDGKSERMAASGKTHLAEPYELQAAIGIYPLPTLDQIVGAIPIVNVLLLGEDRALAGFYFTVTGVWTKPKVEPLLVKSVASGPASLVLEGVPNFVFGSLKAIGEILSPPAARKEEKEAPAAPVAPAPEGAGPRSGMRQQLDATRAAR
jgi:hypothetical protein